MIYTFCLNNKESVFQNKNKGATTAPHPEQILFIKPLNVNLEKTLMTIKQAIPGVFPKYCSHSNGYL